MRAFLAWLFVSWCVAAPALCGVAGSGHNSVPEEVIQSALHYISGRIGEELVRSSVHYFGGRVTSGSSKAKATTYICDFVFFPQDNPLVSVVFNLRRTNEGEWRSPPDRPVPNCKENPDLCRVNVALEAAVEIARQSGLEPGEEDWKVELRTISHCDGIVWTVSNSFPRTAQGVVGKTIVVNAYTGEQLEELLTISMP